MERNRKMLQKLITRVTSQEFINNVTHFKHRQILIDCGVDAIPQCDIVRIYMKLMGNFQTDIIYYDVHIVLT